MVRVWRVEGEVVEAGVEIGLDLLDVLVRVDGDDEPHRGLLDRELVGQPLLPGPAPRAGARVR